MMLTNNLLGITLLPFSKKDIDLYAKWYDKEHVGRWLGGDTEKEAWLEELHNKDSKYDWLIHYIVLYNGVKIGYCHYYDCFFVNDYHRFSNITKAEYSYGIGYLIGEEEYLGIGLGKAIVKQLEEMIITIGGKEIYADPIPENIASIKTLLANGFIKIKDGEYKKVLG